LGGKNACIIYPDADIEKAAVAAVNGMNFTWCGQSCGSTSRLFIHESVYERVMQIVLERIQRYVPGLPHQMDTTMGALISKAQMDKVLSYIEIAKSEGATLACGGRRPADPALANGFFVEPTVFTDVTQNMRIAKEEVFGPILSVLKWRDEDQMIAQVNSVEYGLTASIWTTGLANAHRAATRIQAGFVWVNHIGAHFQGASFGGYKQSGIGREEGLEELYSFTQNKNIHIVP
jgi:betaine-aldehyde dehydrogenase